MASYADLASRQRPARAQALTFDGARDRSAAFGKARRHSMYVRSLRMLLPVLAVALFASYGLFAQRSFRVGLGQVSVGPIAVSGEYLVAQNPHYDGFNKDGSRFDVRAKTAEHNFGQTGPIKLNTIDGTLVETNNTKTLLKAVRGSFDTQTNVLELYERIDVTSESGLVAELTRATDYAKENRIVSPEPVTVTMPTGTVHGNEMVLLQKTRQIAFGGGVTANLRPQQRPGQEGAAAAPVRPTGSSLMGASNAPIDVTSATLDVDDVQRVAVFRGDVRAKQAEATLAAPELEVRYDGQPAGAPAAPASAAAGRLKRLIVPSNLVLTQGADRVTSERGDFDAETDKAILLGAVEITSGRDRRATAERADLDARADNALLTGNVVVTQGKNVLKGRRLFVDRKAGTSQLSAPAGQGTPRGRIAARFYRTEADGAPKAKAAAQAAPRADPTGITFQTDPNAPIDVDADVLDSDDRTKTATFRGQVKAVQGEFTMITPELVATYTGDTGIGLPGQTGAGSAPAQLQRIQGKKRVVITSRDDQKAVGDFADFDVKANTVTLTGDVVLTRGRQVINGPKLVIDMTTGVSRMETSHPHVAAPSQQQTAPVPANQGKDAGSAQATPAAGAGPHAGAGGCPPGRMCGLFYLDDVKSMAKQKGPAAVKKLEGGKGAGSEPDGGAARGSSWSATTDGSGDSRD